MYWLVHNFRYTPDAREHRRCVKLGNTSMLIDGDWYTTSAWGECQLYCLVLGMSFSSFRQIYI